MDDKVLAEEATTRVSSRIRRHIHEGKAVFEKQYTTDEWTGTADVIRKRAEREQLILEEMQANGLFRRRLGVVRVASCDPQQAKIVTHEVPGQSLANWLRDPLHANASLVPWYLAGRWLRQFQSIPVAASAFEQLSDRDPARLVDYCDIRLQSIQELGYRWPDAATRQRLLSVLESLESEYEPWARRAVWVHADYSPGNLIWGGGVLTPIDFANVRTGSPLADATYLVHRLEMQRVYRPWRRLPVTAFQRAILRGLGQPDADCSAAYRAMMIRHLVCRLHTYVWRRPGSLRQSLHNRWVRAVIRRHLMSLVRRTQF